MSRHVSKADEATSWRRTTALTSNDHHSSKQAGGYHHHRSQSAEPTVHAASRQQHYAAHQPLEPHKPTPAHFSAEEAQQLLEKRWSEVTAQGLQPACQCSNSKEDEKEDGSSKGASSSSEGGSGFLQALQAAVKVNSADAAWDDD